jgi:hypothetical protein
MNSQTDDSYSTKFAFTYNFEKYVLFIHMVVLEIYKQACITIRAYFFSRSLSYTLVLDF